MPSGRLRAADQSAYALARGWFHQPLAYPYSKHHPRAGQARHCWTCCHRQRGVSRGRRFV